MVTVYDELPYPGLPFAETHPDRLATMAALFGMAPAPVDRCRVLELGCGDAGNLIPMAFTLPNSTFTGIDLAGTAILRGQELADQLGLSNIDLRQLDLLDFVPNSGEFDYIIAHGLYSWVPPDARERILEICKTHLAPNGVAYISYNTYPGGHLREAVRRMMQYHVRDVVGSEERCKHARELLEFLLAAHTGRDEYEVFLRSQVQYILETGPGHFFHDELNEFNYRFYFHEFVKDAARHSLQFISETQLLSSQSDVLPPGVAERMPAFGEEDHLVREQYLDFVKLRNFRKSLLCHSAVHLDRRLDPSIVLRMFAASPASPASAQLNVSETAAEEFKFPKGGNMSTNHPLAKAAMLHLGRIWPAVISFPDLLKTARSLSGRDSPSANAPFEEDEAWLSDMLLKLFAANFAELHAYIPAGANSVSERPVSSPVARAQLPHGQRVTNLRHASISVDDESGRLLLSLMDGTRDRAQLLSELNKHFHSVTAEELEVNLNEMAKMSLLAA